MNYDIHKLLALMLSSSRDEIWESAKRVESLTNELVSSLLGLLEEGGLPDTRAAAAYVLGFGRYASARLPLERVLENTDEAPFVRGHAAEALGYIQNRDSAEVLLKQLKDPNPAVRYWCIFALSQVGDRKAIPVLKKAAESSGNDHYEGHSLRDEALDAISEIERSHRMSTGD